MKLAITDACIFIDLHDLELTAPFFNLSFEFHTSIDVINELFENQQQTLTSFEACGKLKIHNITEEDKKSILAIPYPKSLSESDKTVLFLASKLDAMVISSDKMIRNTAKSTAIDYHGMIWIFDQLIDNNLISKTTASIKLQQLISTNIVFQNNRELVQEMEKRLRLWQKVI